nr:uncharacterized protein LOC113395560 [Vanessa tameamea]
MNNIDYNIIKLIMTTRLFLGCYSKLHNSLAFAVFAKIYCIAFAIVLMYFCNYEFMLTDQIGSVIIIILKILNLSFSLLVSLISDGENFFNYLEESDKVDPLGLVKIEKHKVRFCFFIFIGVFLLNLYRFMITWPFTLNWFGKIILVTNTLMLLSLHLNHMTRMMMFEILWVRLKSLRIAMNISANTSNPESEMQVKLSSMKLIEYLLIYSRLLRSIKNIGNAPKLLMVMALPTCFISLLSTVEVISQNMRSKFNIIFTIEAFLNIVLPCVLAVFGELGSAEADKIKSNMIRRYRVCNNDALRNKILDGIKFLEICPMNVTVWRIFAVNVSLLLSIVGIYTTYTIVLLQFNNLKT